MTPVLHISIAGFFMGSLGLLLGLVLAVANRRLHVHEDPRIEEVEELLPHANCGACGEPGCRSFAESVVAGDATPGQCTVNASDANEAIAEFLGVEVGEQEKQLPRLACAGGNHVAYLRASYQGMETCRAAAVVSGGGKGCVWGCLGLGDCAAVCDFAAIELDPNGLPVVDAALCTACGDCCEVCPKDLFSLQPVSRRLWVACANRDPEDEGRANCEVVCTACGRCEADAPEGVIHMQGELAVIDYDRNELASRLAIERCPTGAIVWLDDQRGVIKGSDAKKVVRKQPLPVG